MLKKRSGVIGNLKDVGKLRTRSKRTPTPTLSGDIKSENRTTS
jgi:hypothetical protein